MPCPCGSKREFSQCCKPFIAEDFFPETPEQLMRSRYTAYSKANIEYIQKTMCGEAIKNFNMEEARRWAKRAKWLDLQVVQASSIQHNQGTVEFIARYIYKDKIETIHEVSTFEKIDGRWFYTDSSFSNIR